MKAHMRSESFLACEAARTDKNRLHGIEVFRAKPIKKCD
jgi:hypothetical protein